MVFLALPACGKKGPPEVPDKPELPVVENLKVARQDQNLVLQWSLPEAADEKAPQAAGFYIYKSAVRVEADCPGCPVQFEQAGRVPYQASSDGTEAWSFRDLCEKGFICRYRVRAFDAEGAAGPASNIVTVTVQANAEH